MMNRLLNQTLLAALLAAPCALLLAVGQSRAATPAAGSEKMDKAYVVSNAAVNDSTGADGSKTVADLDFVEKAARAGNAEIELSQLALQTSKNEKVRYFAEKMVKDHSAAARDLKAIAGKHGVAVPAGTDTAHAKLLDRLAAMDNRHFDAAYMDQMIADHELAVALFRQESEHGKDAELRAYASKTLRHLLEHQQSARDTRQKL